MGDLDLLGRNGVDFYSADGLTPPRLIVVFNDGPPNQTPVVNDQSLPPIDENSAGGTVVGTVVASDPDGNNLSYAITAGNIDGAFAINGSSGQISVDQSKCDGF